MVENAKIEKFKCDILSNFETMCWMFYQEKMSKYVWEIKTPFILVNFGFFCRTCQNTRYMAKSLGFTVLVHQIPAKRCRISPGGTINDQGIDTSTGGFSHHESNEIQPQLTNN